MKKKTIFIIALLALCMAVAFAGCGSDDSKTAASGGEGQQEDTQCEYEFPATGFGFDLPESVEINKGCISAHDMGEVNYGCGVLMGWPVYVDVPAEKYNTLTMEEAKDVNTGATFHIACVKDVSSPEEAIEKVVTVMKELEGDGYSKEEDALYRGMEELHREGDFIWMVDKPKKKSEGIRKECQTEYDAFYDATDEILSNMKFSTPELWEGGEEGADVVFETTDLDGKKIDSKELFAKNKVTMINIWATTCGPCIEEMPELEKLNKEWSKKGGAVVGLVDDVPVGNSEYLHDAQEIIMDTGVTYTNLRAWDGYIDVMSKVGTPTTYFVDSSGKLIGDPILGANVKKYKEAMEKYLSEAK